MSDVFISYSRENSEFSKKLNERLALANKDSWVDWEDIPLTADWWLEIKDGIEKAHNFIFIISPDSLKSFVCNLEVNHAIAIGKRIIPIVYQDVKPEEAIASIAVFAPDESLKELLEGQDQLEVIRNNWQRLSHINWIFFRDEDDFDTAFTSLLKIVDTDLDYVKAHTRYLNRAKEWQRNEQRSDLLLFGEEIAPAEEWLIKAERYTIESKGKTEQDIANPELQTEQRNYIEKSRQEDTRRKRVTRSTQASIAVLAIVLIGGAIIGFTALNGLNTRIDDANSQLGTATEALNSISTQVADANNQVIEAEEQADIASTQVSVANNQLATATQALVTATRIAELEAEAQATLGAVKTQVQIAEDYIEALRLAAEAQDILIEPSGNRDLSTLLSLRSLNTAYSSQGDTSLLQSVIQTYPNLTLSHNDEIVRAIDSSDEFEIVATGSVGGTIRIWDIHTGNLLHELIGHSEAILDLEFSSDSSQLVSADESGSILIWETETWSIFHTLSGHSEKVNSIAFSPDGEIIASASSDESVKLWNSRTGSLLDTFTFNGFLTHIEFLTENRLIIVIGPEIDNETQPGFIGFLFTYGQSFDNDLVIFDTELERIIQRYSSESPLTRSARISPARNLIAIYSGNNFVEINNFPVGRSLFTLSSGPYSFIEFYPNEEELIAGTTTGIIEIWDIDKQNISHYLTGHDDSIIDISTLIMDEQVFVISSSLDRQIRIWNINTPSYITRQNMGVLTAIDYSDEFIVVGREDGFIELYDFENNLIFTHQVNDENIRRIILSPTGQYAAISTDSITCFWNLIENEIFCTEQIFPSLAITFNKFYPDQILIEDYNNLRLFDLNTQQEVNTIEVNTIEVETGVSSLLLNGNIIIAGIIDENMRMIAIHSGDLIREIPIQGVSNLRYIDQNRKLLIRTQSTFYVWDMINNEIILELDAPPINDFIVSDSNTLIIGWSQNSIYIWDSSNFILRREISNHRTSNILMININESNNTMIVAYEDGIIIEVPINISDYTQLVCNHITSDFSDNQQERYELDDTATCEDYEF